MGLKINNETITNYSSGEIVKVNALPDTPVYVAFYPPKEYFDPLIFKLKDMNKESYVYINSTSKDEGSDIGLISFMGTGKSGDSFLMTQETKTITTWRATYKSKSEFFNTCKNSKVKVFTDKTMLAK
jgi:hypothetical protein